MASRDVSPTKSNRAIGASNATYAFAMSFFDELARCRVRHVCISPGSRSTPLAVAAGLTQSLQVWSHLDERASGFFALGLAKATRQPVALVCTSGTALANYAPAVLEAHYAGVPLLVLSADRPPELRDWGAGQTIDQIKIFGAQIRFFAELPVPETGPAMLRYVRTLACRAVGESRGPDPGPVHLNWPLREPLEPMPNDRADEHAIGGRFAESARENGRPYVALETQPRLASSAQIEDLALRFQSIERGVIACGAMDEPEFARSIARLATRLGWPVLAEPISGLRRGPHVGDASILAGSDLFLRQPEFKASQRPDAVLRFGGTPTSKAFRMWLEASPPDELVLVVPRSNWDEPSHLTSIRVCADAVDLCNRLSEAIETGSRSRGQTDWLASFLRAEAATQATLDRELAKTSRLFEPRATRVLCDAIPEGSILYVSNSMPVRDLDAFMPAVDSAIRVLGNRGTNGIDGMVSSTLGAAAAQQGHVFLLTGDLAFLYDIGGLLAARRYPLRATIVVFNNDGGGIFSLLPVAQHGESIRFEELFATPHAADLAAVAPLYGVHHHTVEGYADYEEALLKSVDFPGVTVIEVPIDRLANVEHFKELIYKVGEAVENGMMSL